MQRRLKLKLRKRDAVACDLSYVLLQRGQIDLILRDESVVREKDNVRYHLHRSAKNVRFSALHDVGELSSCGLSFDAQQPSGVVDDAVRSLPLVPFETEVVEDYLVRCSNFPAEGAYSLVGLDSLHRRDTE